MFCPNCGTQHPENTSFCSKCGTQMGNQVVGAEIRGAERGKHVQKTVIVGMLGVLLIVGLCLGIGAMTRKNEESGGKEFFEENTNTDSQKHVEEAEDESKNIESIVITGGETLYLEGNYTRLKSIKTNGSLYLEGEFPVLETIEVSSAEEDAVFVCTSDLSFPQLKSLVCGMLLIDGNKEGLLLEKMFPALKSVSIELENKELDNSILSILSYFEFMHESGTLLQYNAAINHTLEDLYGKWTDRNNTLSLSFLENGDVRIADMTGFFGIELMTYSQVDEKTLKFKAKAEGVWNLLSYDVEYELFGDTLRIDILETSFELYRN